jgi:diacylglycerol kinase family enzyme
MPTIAVIVNAGSGSGEGAAAAEAVDAMLKSRGVSASVVVARGREIPAAARQALADGVEIVVAGGGDGTISTVAAQLVGTKAVLGVLPVGTLNHFAKDLGIPLDLEGAVATIVDGQTTAVDVGEANGRIFINNSSLGLYPRLVWERERLRRHGRHRWLALAHAVGHVWAHYRRLHAVIEAEGTRRDVRTPFVFVGNNEYHTQGLQMGGRRGLDHGVLHLCMAPGITRVEILRVMIAALVGRLDDVAHFESLPVPEVAIRSRRRRLGVAFDGEVTTMATPLRYRIRPRALLVRVPVPAPAAGAA